MSSADIYREIILDYYRNPRNYGRLESPDVVVRDTNPLCGDEVEMHIKFEDGKVKDIRFNGKGCAISQASASMLTEMVMGKSLDEVKGLGKQDILETLGLPNLGPARIKCALLSLKVFKLGVYSYIAERMGESEAASIKDEASRLF
ncbi:MAG: SUF system NifU family Fe-S cluster assembly protein [Candidatus Nitrosocaldus sp.]|nr:SUF system NifU family Fe-S cluster assembly protein [Candidatus Nitrosocaldus sp.]MCS7141006.1 SUF system NifU family Fe-S cluster assembly protein [Candidatus Nitrosocaldus sp.]MDW7999916.1 SUF system NifU family Fe-S cluster assembly protein [Candidatus Nitrosocaldus sp.]MDW8275439.1 SUF system NifU family Fe-S cluster assembly protein [Candidatus Nitrosocaldus sp.]